MSIKHIKRSLLDFFLPRLCPTCSFKLKLNESVICDNCLKEIKVTPPKRIENEFEKKFRLDKHIDGFHPAFVFETQGNLQKLIHELKYEKNFLTGKFLGRLTAQRIKKTVDAWQPEIIIPVPLHSLKKAERGYNQSFYIAKGLGSFFNLPVVSNSVKRIRYTESQTTMTLLERKENVKDKFQVKKVGAIKRKKIMLIDDVITTGATVSELASQLKKDGASRVFAASVAIAD